MCSAAAGDGPVGPPGSGICGRISDPGLIRHASASGLISRRPPRQSRPMGWSAGGFAPQYAEFGEFGAFRRESYVIASLNSANGHQILYAREAGIIIAVTGTFGILFGGFPSWVSGVGSVRDRSSGSRWIAHSG